MSAFSDAFCTTFPQWEGLEAWQLCRLAPPSPQGLCTCQALWPTLLFLLFYLIRAHLLHATPLQGSPPLARRTAQDRENLASSWVCPKGLWLPIKITLSQTSLPQAVTHTHSPLLSSLASVSLYSSFIAFSWLLQCKNSIMTNLLQAWDSLIEISF